MLKMVVLLYLCCALFSYLFCSGCTHIGSPFCMTLSFDKIDKLKK